MIFICFFCRSSTTPVSTTTESPPPEITTTRFLDDALSEALSNLPEPLPLTAVAPVGSAPESVLPVAIEVDPCNASSHYVIANEPRRSFNQVRSLTLLLASFFAWLVVVFHGQMTPPAMEKCTKTNCFSDPIWLPTAHVAANGSSRATHLWHVYQERLVPIQKLGRKPDAHRVPRRKLLRYTDASMDERLDRFLKLMTKLMTM